MKETRNLIKMLSEAIDSGRAAAFVTVISVGGSTPREAGAKMLVYSDGSIEGTVGGGSVEALVMKQAVRCISNGEGGKFVFRLKPGGNTGMICMGDMEVYIDVYKIPLKILILGGGHVGLKLAEACRLAGYPYSVADDRKEFANAERFPQASAIINEFPHKAVEAAGVDKDTYVVIMTRGHSLDKECLEAAMKTDAPYIGMIGSAPKVRKLFRQLAKKKVYPLRDKRVHSPIGLDLGGKTPGEIAVSVLSEIIKLHYGRGGGHMRIAK
ncbi:MAG: xanthine dehydrogenase [Elusimicrobia bacterium CG08_land_8_20_14_0_20_59_10]|nr:MAG: xanthine dehydrogenase [Elusimicrobia bacterium CG08_land_8_20_14_0_20_59_10]